jgi:type II secretory pathway component GspD/PulD (secretin)
MVSFPEGIYPWWKLAEYVLLLSTLLITYKISGPQMRRRMLRYLLKLLNLHEIEKLIVDVNEKPERIPINVKNESLKKLFRIIEERTEYTFFYDKKMLKDAGPVTINVKDASVEEILDEAFLQQSKTYHYSRNGKQIVIIRITRKGRIK